MPELENPPENPCFGCGPHHARGLRLKFSKIGAGPSQHIEGTFVPQPDEIGWPTLFHHGLHFMVLYEASYWAALTLGGKVWVSYGASTYDIERLPRVGVEHMVRARIVDRDGARMRIRAEVHNSAGKRCGSLETQWRPASRALAERAGIPLPSYLLSEMDP